jgi:hypothetical protein
MTPLRSPHRTSDATAGLDPHVGIQKRQAFRPSSSVLQLPLYSKFMSDKDQEIKNIDLSQELAEFITKEVKLLSMTFV